MQTAHDILVYWSNHLKEAEYCVEHPWQRGHKLKTLKWMVLARTLNIIAKMYGYSDANNMDFVRDAMELN